MRINWGQNLATGVLFILIGVGALIIGWDYPRGTPQRPGTGVLPVILSWCLIGSGGILAVQSISVGDEKITPFAWRPLLFVTLATVSFGLLIDDWGLIVTMIISLTLCAMGTLETRWREYAVFLAIMLGIGFGMFIWLLGMPIPTWPQKAVPSFLEAILR